MRPTKGKEKEWRFTTCQSKPVQRSQGKSATAAAAYRSGARTGERHNYRKRHGVAVDIAIHAPTEKGDQRNHHAHILATTRELENGQLTGKSDFDLSDRDHKKKGLSGRKQELLVLREEWERLVNQALARAGKKSATRNLKPKGLSDRQPCI